jgi:DnaJ like chaperone protein
VASAPPPSETLTLEAAFAHLGLPRDTTPAAAAKAYRRLLARYHPDKFHDDPEFRALAELKARKLNAAWALVRALCDDGRTRG